MSSLRIDPPHVSSSGRRTTRLILVAGILSCVNIWPEQSEGREDERRTVLRVSAVQFPIEGQQSVEEILDKVESFVRCSIEKKADLIVFPELLTLDAWPLSAIEDGEGRPASRPERTDAEKVRRIAEDVTPQFEAGVRSLAERYKVAILAGSSPQLRGENIYNSSLLIFPDGRELRQDKLNLTSWEKSAGFRPGETLSVARTRWGNIAILICYDVEFPDLSCLLIPQRPSVLLVPSMTESRAGLERVRWTARARSVEHHAFVIISSTVGQTSPNWRHFGQAATISPRSEAFPVEEVAGNENEPDFIVHPFDLSELAASRDETTFDPSEDVRKRKATIQVVITDFVGGD